MAPLEARASRAAALSGLTSWEGVSSCGVPGRLLSTTTLATTRDDDDGDDPAKRKRARGKGAAWTPGEASLLGAAAAEVPVAIAAAWLWLSCGGRCQSPRNDYAVFPPLAPAKRVCLFSDGRLPRRDPVTDCTSYERTVYRSAGRKQKAITQKQTANTLLVLFSYLLAGPRRLGC